MDVLSLIRNNGLETIPNPNYNPKSKKNKQPKTLTVADVTPDDNPALNLALTDARNKQSFDAKTVEKYAKYGLNYNTWEDLDSQLAEKQSNWEKARNALYQTVVNEVGLGTLKGISDLFDMVYNAAVNTVTGEKNDYSNPVSQKLQEWQDEFKENYDIYTRQGIDISNGGLGDFGWWMSNIPSVASSLTLLIPSTGVTKGLSLLGKTFKVGKGLTKARKFLTNINKVDKAVEEGKTLSRLGKARQWINNENTIATANRLLENTVTGFTSRLMENYQEANQVYNDLLPQMLDGDKENNIQGINEMNEQEYAALIDRNKDVLDGVDTSNRLEVAKALASAGATRTFRADLINGLFDVYELYGLRNFKPLKSMPMRASVRRAHLNSIKYAGKTEEEIAKIMAGRSMFAKGKEWIGDRLIGSKHAVLGQFSEGLEEAINYVAQEEGMHYGHVLLNQEDKASNFDDRLIQYMKNPQLYEAAFWGVAGGVIFQQGGSGFNRIQNVIENKRNKSKYEATDKSGEAVKKTPWHAAFESPEIEARVADVNSRAKYDQQLKTELKQIKDGIDPFNLNPDGTHASLNSDEEKAVARDRAYRKRTINLLMNSMFNGNWDITRAYLESDEVRDALVQAGIISPEEATKRQQEAKEIADKLEQSYSRNLRAVGNAMRTVKGEDDREKIPIEYMQIIAAENMWHELDAEQYQRNIDNYTPLVESEEARIADELAANGIDYKASIKAYILAQQLGEVEAELENARKTVEEGKSKTDIDSRTISGQIGIKNLERRKQVLTDMINQLNPNYVIAEGDEENVNAANKINRTAITLTTLRAAAGIEKGSNGKYRVNENTKRYKDLDAAIVKAFNAKDDNEWSTASEELYLLAPELREHGHTRESFQEAARAADVFDENVKKALGPEGAVESLDNLSHNLLKAYATISYNEIAKNYELAGIVKDRKSVRQAAFAKHTEITSSRGQAVEMAVYGLKGLFKKYYGDNGDISQLLATGTTDRDSREMLKFILSSDDMETYDKFMEILRLNTPSVTGRTKYNTSVINDPLIEMVQNALYQSSLDKFEDYREETPNTEDETEEEATEISDTTSEEETKKKSSTSKKRASEPKKSSTINNTQKDLNDDTEQESGQKIDFTHNKQGRQLTSPYADVTVESDEDAADNNRMPVITKLNQYDRTKNEDSYSSVTLIPTENENEYELDYKGDFDADDAKTGKIPKVLTNTSIFNWNTGESISEGGEILSNPRVTIDNNGNVIGDIIKGKIGIRGKTDEDGEVQGDEESDTEDAISSTGGRSPRTDVDEEVDVETFDEYEAPAEEVEYTREEVQETLSEDMMFYALDKQEAGEEFDEGELLDLLIKNHPEFNEEDIRNEFQRIKKDGYEIAKQLNLGIKAVENIAKFVQNSAIADSDLGASETTKAHNKMEQLFKEILNDYLNRTVRFVRTKGKKEIKVISLENLLRYCNKVAGNKAFGRVLYDRFLDMIEERKDIELMEGTNLKKLPKQKIIAKAEMSVQERQRVTEIANGRSIDFDYIIDNLETEAEKEEVRNAIDSLVPDDELQYEVTKNAILFKKNDITIASIPIPKEEGNRFKLNNNGWIIDIPTVNDGTQSETEQLFIDIMANPQDKAEYKPIVEALEKAMYTKRYDNESDRRKRKYSKTFVKACEAIMDAIKDAGIDTTKYLKFPDNKDYDDAGRQLVDVYMGMKRATEQWISDAGLSKEEYRKAVANRRIESIHRFFQNRTDSAFSAYALTNNPNLTIKVDDVREGGLNITSRDEALLLNDKKAIGSDHKDSIEICAASISEAGVVYTTNGQSIPFPGVGAANTFVAIKRANGSYELVHAYPQGINSNHFTKPVKEIHTEVLNEFGRLLNEWGANPNKSTLELAKFIKTLCSADNGNNALFKGFRVSNLTGGFSGIQIEYIENGNRKYIHLFDRNTFGDIASVIRFHGEKAKAFQKEDVRKEVIEKFKEIVSKSLNYNLEFDYIKGAKDLKGFAKRNAKGEFIIQIPGGKRHKFKSFKDFVINNGIVSVTTRSVDGKTNFYKKRYQGNDPMDNPRYTYRIVSQVTTPVEERIPSNELQPSTTTEDLTDIEYFSGDDAKEAIQNNGSDPNLAQDIISKILNNTQLKILKDSKILKDFTFGSIIFVDRLNPDTTVEDTFAAHVPTTRTIQGIKVAKGTIIVTQRWINLLNSDSQADREQAVRHLIHEAVHRKIATLSKEDKRQLFDELRSIFNDFVSANGSDGVREEWSRFEYNTNAKDRAKYYRNKEINDKGLEEFLIESLTRPELMNRLNSISADGKKITNQTVGNVKSKTLLQRLLAAIAKMFDRFINKGSLLEKEYKLFEKLSAFNDNVSGTVATQKRTNKAKPKNEAQLEINFDVETKKQEKDIDKPVDTPTVSTPTNSEAPINVSQGVKDATMSNARRSRFLQNDDLVDESSIADKEISSTAQVRDKIIPENQDTFESLIQKGGIEINC